MKWFLPCKNKLLYYKPKDRHPFWLAKDPKQSVSAKDPLSPTPVTHMERC